MKKLLILSLLLILIMLVSCNGTEANSNLQSYLDSITEEELVELLTYLASDELEGRLSGEKGCEVAADYIAKEFEEYGLTPGMGDSYFQHFDFVEAMEKGDDAHFIINKGGQILELEYETDYHVMINSIETNLEGEIAFAGYSITNDNYDDYEGIDVDGKIVLVLRGSPLGTSDTSYDPYFISKVTNAINHGAKGFILVNNPKQYPSDPPLQSIYLGNLEPNMPILQLRQEGAKKLLALENLELESLQEEIDSNYKPKSFIFKNVKVDLNTDLKPIIEETYNVLAYLPGNDPDLKDEVIVLGAHYDHLGYGEVGARIFGEIHNGADDNGSGVVALMEVAEALSMIKDKINRTIVFITFSAEEYGLFGSRYYVENPIFPIENTVFMCNLDMIGYLDEDLTALSTTSDTIYDILEQLDEKYSFGVYITADGGGSDHYHFQQAGVPTTFLHTGLHDNYHTPEDDIEYINFEGLTQISKFIFELIYEVDVLAERPTTD